VPQSRGWNRTTKSCDGVPVSQGTEPPWLESYLRSYIVQDGTYITGPQLQLKGGDGRNADIALLTGNNRDEMAITLPIPPEGVPIEVWFAQAAALGLDLTPVLAHRDKFDIPQNPTAADIFNVSVRVGSDGTFRCMGMATAVAAAKYGTFKNVYTYLFNRTFNPTGYTQPQCQAPKTADHPNGDPNLEYYKCHGGQQLHVFGNIFRVGQPERDGKDLLFMQLIVDYWSAFVRSRNPNPDPEYLVARGYQNSHDQVRQNGRWEAVDAANPRLRLLQWRDRMSPLPEFEQCQLLGLPLNYYDSH
jgi:hypothetical protein